METLSFYKSHKVISIISVLETFILLSVFYRRLLNYNQFSSLQTKILYFGLFQTKTRNMNLKEIIYPVQLNMLPWNAI